MVYTAFEIFNLTVNLSSLVRSTSLLLFPLKVDRKTNYSTNKNNYTKTRCVHKFNSLFLLT